jgi:hypothetical protein
MDIPDDLLDRAFAIYEEFGPDRLKDRKERLKSQFEQLSTEEIEFVIERMKEVSTTIWILARQGGEIKLGKEKVRALLQAAHPFLQSLGLQKSLFLVNYFAWHDGFDE